MQDQILELQQRSKMSWISGLKRNEMQKQADDMRRLAG